MLIEIRSSEQDVLISDSKDAKGFIQPLHGVSELSSYVGNGYSAGVMSQ